MGRGTQTSIPDADLKRAANALRKAGKTAEAKRLERNLPAPTVAKVKRK